jgi:hypothetical protein
MTDPFGPLRGPAGLFTNPALAALWSGYLLVAARVSQDLFLAAKDLSFAATANRSGVFSLRLACEPSLSNHLGDRRSVAASVRC